MFASQIEREFGGIDILFANAGIQSFHPPIDMQDSDWIITIDVNLTGTAARRGGGRIIVTSSTQGRHGMKYGADYSAHKIFYWRGDFHIISRVKFLSYTYPIQEMEQEKLVEAYRPINNSAVNYVNQIIFVFANRSHR